MTRFSLSPDLHPGYRLVRPRGRGGFGEVWEAETADGQAAALKFMRCGRDRGAAGELRSIQLVQHLSHAHLLRIDRVWCAADYLVVAMELADGSLSDLLEVYQADLGTPFPADHVMPFLAQAAAALDFLNNRQHLINGQWVTIQHCDVTPTNILVCGDSVKLSDFGLTTTLVTREKIHQRAGTPAFAAPEVYQARVSHRTDQYALAVCYCLLRGGCLPFRDTPAAFQADYVRPAPELGTLEQAERPVVARALAAAPQDRWPSSRDFIAELDKALSSSTKKEIKQVERRREPRYRPEHRVDCKVLPTLGNQAWGAEVLNVSAGGARLRLVKPQCEIQPGRLLELVLTNGKGGVGLTVSFRLAHSTELPGGDYDVGGAFLEPLSQQHLAVLADGIR